MKSTFIGNIISLAVMLVVMLSGSEGSDVCEIEFKYAERIKLNKTEAGYELFIWPKGLDATPVKTAIHLVSANRVESPVGLRPPFQKLVLRSTTHLAYFEALDALDHVQGISDDSYVFSDKVKTLMRTKKMLVLGQNMKLDEERLIACSPDLILDYVVEGDLEKDTQRRERWGLKTLGLAAYLETHPLGRLEWIKLIGLLVGKVDEAKAIFEQKAKRYLELVELVKAIKNRPKVFCNSPFGGVWYMPRANSYFAKFIQDSGANYLFDELKGTGAEGLSFEVVLSKGMAADFWLNPLMQWRTLNELLAADERYRLFPCVNKDGVFSNIGRVNELGGNDFYESGVVCPDVMLEDLIKIFHPKLLENDSLFYYRPLKITK